MLGEEFSQNKKYSIRYYESFAPFKVNWTMPGDESCKPIWVRLYNDSGNKINEVFSNNCELENEITWLEKEVILPDGNTIWALE